MQYLLEPARQRAGSKSVNNVVNKLVVNIVRRTRRAVAIR
jgi:hypothetical protein